MLGEVKGADPLVCIDAGYPSIEAPARYHRDRVVGGIYQRARPKGRKEQAIAYSFIVPGPLVLLKLRLAS